MSMSLRIMLFTLLFTTMIYGVVAAEKGQATVHERLVVGGNTETIPVMDWGYDIPAYGGPWAVIHRDNRNSDYAPVPVASVYESDFETIQSKQRTFNHAVIGPRLGPDKEGYVYYTILGYGLYSYGHFFVGKDAGTGQTVVKFGPGSVDKQVTAANALVGSDGSFFLADNEKVMRYSPEGKPLWVKPTSIAGIQPSAPQFTPDGKLLIMTWNGRVHVIEPENGDILWERNMTPFRSYPSEFPGYCVGYGISGDCAYANTPAVDPNTNTIYQTFNNRYGKTFIHKYRYDLISHNLVLIEESACLGRGSASSITLSANYQKMYINDMEYHILAYDVDELDIPLWTVDIGYNPSGSLAVNPNGFIVPNGSSADLNFKIKVIRDMEDYGEVLFEDNEYIPISSPAAGLDNRFVIIACKKNGEDVEQKGAMGLVVFDPSGIVSFTPWKNECLDAPVTTSLGENGSVYVVGSGSVGLKKFRPVSQ